MNSLDSFTSFCRFLLMWILPFVNSSLNLWIPPFEDSSSSGTVPDGTTWLLDSFLPLEPFPIILLDSSVSLEPASNWLLDSCASSIPGTDNFFLVPPSPSTVFFHGFQSEVMPSFFVSSLHPWSLTTTPRDIIVKKGAVKKARDHTSGCSSNS